jgi:hypothetical protein
MYMTEAATDIVSQPQDQPTSTLPAGPRRDAGGRWLKGVSGNARGTLEGSRRAFSANFIRTLADDFRLHGRQAIEKVRKTQPAAYMKICALLVPKELKVEHQAGVASLSDEELYQAIAAIRAMLDARAGNAAKVVEGRAVELRVLTASPAKGAEQDCSDGCSLHSSETQGGGYTSPIQ